MNKIILIALTFIFLSYSIDVVTAISYKVWAESPRLITVGEPTKIQINVFKNASGIDSYTITPTVVSVLDYSNRNVPQLLSISIPSNRINNLKPNDTGTTFVNVIAYGKIKIATISITVDPDIGPVVTTTAVELKSALPTSLPEFSIIGLSILLLLSLILYQNHVRIKNI